MFLYPRKVEEIGTIIRDVSILTFFLGFLFLIPLVVGIIYNEASWPVYLLLLLITSGPSYVFMKIFKSDKKPFTQITIVSLAVMWITFSVVGSYAFIAIGGMSPLDSYFESVSSISTAGLSVIKIPELVPKSLLFWRSLLSWFGGIGITAFALHSILQSESVARIVLGEGFEHIKPSLVNSAKEMLKIYAFWTIIGIVIMVAIGIPVFDSFNLSMNAISTTGVDIHSGGWTYYEKNMPSAFPVMVLVVAILMIMGAVSFIAHYRVLKNRRLGEYLRQGETKFYIGVLLVGVGLISSYLILNNQNPTAFAYEAISTSTTGGYELSPYIAKDAGNFVMAILIILALIGGSSNSAAGGIKAYRIHLMLKYIIWKTKQQVYPSGAVTHLKHDGKVVTSEQISDIAIYAFIYCVAIIVVSTMIIGVQEDIKPTDTLLMVSSAQSGGGISPIAAYALRWPAKVGLIGTMLFGRLEFYPLFALIGYILRRY